jgi:hypothetical protein
MSEWMDELEMNGCDSDVHEHMKTENKIKIKLEME